MDVLERYLQAVKFFLPAKARDDIASELSQNLLAQIEDREAELERPLTQAELSELLRQHGHPVVVASRYRQGQALIGGVFFPAYLFVLQVGLAICALVSVVFAVATTAFEGNAAEHVIAAILAFPGRAVVVFGWITIVFAIAERAGLHVRLTRSWDPLALPKVVPDDRVLSRSRAVLELVALLLGVVWLLAMTQSPSWLLGPASSSMELAPIWKVAFPPILASTLATAALQATNLARPYWTPTRAKLRLLTQVASLGVIALLLSAGTWLVPAAALPAAEAASVQSLVEVINTSVFIGLVVAGLITLLDMARELRRLKRGGDGSSLGMACSVL
jgi:hypothetical protein